MTKQPPLQVTSTYRAYLKDITVFPKEKLIDSGISQAGISFILSLMMPHPEDRSTPEKALQDSWLQPGKDEPEHERNGGGSCEGAQGCSRRTSIINPLLTNTQDESSSSHTTLVLEEIPDELDLVIEGSGHITSNTVACAGYLSLFFISLLITAIKLETYNETYEYFFSPPVRVHALRTEVCQPRLETSVWLFSDMKDTCAKIGGPETEDRKMALWLAVEKNQIDVVEKLLEEGIETRAEPDGRSVLQWAVSHGNTGMVELLLRYGADPPPTDRSGITALHFAAAHGYQGIAKSLIEHGANITAKDNEGNTPMGLAVTRKNGEIVKLLKERGADIMSEIIPVSYRQSLIYGVGIAKVDRIKTSVRDYWGRTPLHLAACLGDEKAVRLLLKRWADVNAVDYNKRTALHLAALVGDEKVIRALLESGANTMARSNLGDTVLHAATNIGGERIVQLILVNGANNLAAYYRGRTALHQATMSGDQKSVRFLLEKGADIMEKEKATGRTALHLAVIRRDKGMVRLLLEGRKYLLESRDNYDEQPLHKAIDSRDLAITRILLDNGALNFMRHIELAALVASTDARMRKLLFEHGVVERPGSHCRGLLLLNDPRSKLKIEQEGYCRTL